MGFPGMNRLYMNGRTDHDDEDPWERLLRRGTPPAEAPAEGKTPSGRRGRGFNWGNALLGFFGGPGVVNSLMTQRRAARAAELEAEQEGRRMEAAGNLGYSKDEINLLERGDISSNYRQRIDPFSLAPGTRRVVPGQAGRPEQITENPDAFTQTLIRAGIDPTSPEAQTLYRQSAQNQAGSPYQFVPTQPGGDVAVMNRFTAQEVGPNGGTQDGPPPPPQPGEVRRGYRFRGGDPANPDSWEPVHGGAAPANGPRRFR